MASYHFTDHFSRQPTDEPSLDELFAEPIIQLVMQRDGVNAQDVRHELVQLMAESA
jgi:hypothetical protein